MKILILSVFVFVGFIDSANGQTVRADKHKEFKNIVETMRALAHFKEGSGRNTMYVSDITQDAEEAFAYVYWKEDKSITILQMPLIVPVKKNSPQYYWLTSKARINLETDVVPTQDDIHGSSFLVDRKWVNDILRRCTNGVRLRF